MIDISVDTWISNEFDRAMINKSGLLETLISENADGVEFAFSDEFMPEFSGKNDPEYFQLWHGNNTFERSKTLNLFENHTLPRSDVSLNEHSITDITLPDGRSGRMYFTKFKPQIHTDIREEQGDKLVNFVKAQELMGLAYALSKEGLNQVLWFVDIIFIFTSVIAVFAVRIIVFNVVERGLIPLDILNSELKKINLNSDVSALSTTKLPEELMAIAEGINRFISENKKLYSREQRITSDIAHELKTPITELLNLSEVAIKFPHEKQLTEHFKEDVLAITKRLKNIVNSILLLQKSTSKADIKIEKIDLSTLIESTIAIENKINREIIVQSNTQCPTIKTNEFALTTILKNLINNAIFYSPNSTPINITIEPSLTTEQVIISISNISNITYSEEDLALFLSLYGKKILLEHLLKGMG
ncbi:HAMP domain-containing histidine kinase [Colwellia sp. MSW7]|uniref:histidine kinase n=1 Tax=Colwellia maritima TaxID=2912588 RepID=A0ABS9WXE8_9GAMM|nr:HAMP domain-containing sensor histidine kinase [Colwellia maritima]MCI2282667.1 HAMP domain-containing histidine kinase [Colwellia maritima]